MRTTTPARLPALVEVVLITTAALAVAGCGDTLGPDIYRTPEPALRIEDFSGIALFTQNVIPEVTMDALYEGRVDIDADGCLRLDTPDAPTVVWPLGYDLEGQGDVVAILDRHGETVGVAGGAFSLAGGEVDELTAAMGFDDEDRARAEERCPGEYWIVAG